MTPSNLKNAPVWDSEIQNLQYNTNIAFGFGSKYGDIIYRLQKPGDKIRWLIFSVDSTYYISKQQEINSEWHELWTKQMNEDLAEAKKYCEEDAFQNYA